MSKEELYDLLISCLPAQLTAITVKLNLNAAYLPPANVSTAERAEAILRLAGQKFGSLELLAELINQIMGRTANRPSGPSVVEKPLLPTTENHPNAVVKVFISYAHTSPEHKQTVYTLANNLRSSGLAVLIDTDVRAPQGPVEGWPKWMKSQLQQADWVLLFFDPIYRRRFDGMEEADVGLGATWETSIIANELYLAQTQNTRFIPLLPDDGDTKLIPLELSGATYYRIPKQSDGLARLLVQSSHPA
jgi:hypothetical protein